jgi:hypothetical protein
MRPQASLPADEESVELTDEQRASAAARAVEQVASTLAADSYF